MKKNDYCMVKPLSGEEHVQVSGGCMWKILKPSLFGRVIMI